MTNASTWRVAEVTKVVEETPSVKTFQLRLPQPVAHLPGQHYEVRLTAADGYQAARLYSAASIADGSDLLELTVGTVRDGEVTPYLNGHVKVGDQLEVRGPLGKFFVWDARTAGPTLLLAGGSGVVPMRAILQAHAASSAKNPLRLLYSSRTYEDIIYKDSLLHDDRVGITISRQAPSDWTGPSGRISSNLLASTLKEIGPDPICFVCGMTPFVESISNLLVAAGVPAGRIKTERYGST